MIISVKSENFKYHHAHNIHLKPETIEETYYHHEILRISTDILRDIILKNNFKIKLFISTNTYDKKDWERNRVQKYKYKKNKLWKWGHIKEYWGDINSVESEIIRGDGEIFYADVIDISIDNLSRALSWSYGEYYSGYFHHAESFIFLTTDKTDFNYLTVENIAQALVTNTNCPKHYKGLNYCSDFQSLIDFMNKYQAIPILLVEYHGVQIDFNLHIFAPKNILTLENNFNDYK